MENKPATGPVRLSKEDFLTQFDLAETWGLWMHPVDQEVELIVHDAVTGDLTAYRGPHPIDMNQIEYAAFAQEVEKITERKEAPGGGEPKPS
jgi:hypothetical protein